MTTSTPKAPPTDPAAPLLDLPPAAGSVGTGASPAGRSTLLVNSVALVLASVVTGLVGLAFWAVAARLHAPAVVGQSSALLSSGIMLATVATLSLGSMFERFLPLAGARRGALVLRGHLVAVGAGALLGAVFVLLGPRDRLFDSTADALLFPLLVALLAVFALQDQVLTGMQVARWAALKNTGASVAKLGLLALLGTAAGTAAVVGSWALPSLVAVVVVGTVIARTLRRDRSAVTGGAQTTSVGERELPPRSDLWRYFWGTLGIGLVGTVTPLALPLVVVDRLGVETNAFFAVSWSLVSALYVMMIVVIGPFVAEAAAHPEQLRTLTRRFGGLLAVTALGAGLFLVVAAPTALGLIGAEYREQGTPLMHLTAFALPLAMVGVLYNGLARVRRKLRLAVAVQTMSAVVVVGGSYLLAPDLGLRGVGIAYLTAEALTAAVLVVPLVRLLRLPATGERAS